MLQRVQQFFQSIRPQSTRPFRVKLRADRSALCALVLTGLIGLQWAAPLTGFALNTDGGFWTRPSYERKMNEVGDKILAANHIQTPILFRMSENATDIDAQAESKHHIISVGSALFPMMRSDDELAAVLSHEIAHIITGKSGHLAGGQISMLDILGTVIFVPDAILTTISMGKSVKERLGRATLQNRETGMDLIGIDLMVKAGYNPTAMESILKEIATDQGNKHWRNRVTITDRLTRIHSAIALKYPEFLPAQEDPATPQHPSTVMLPADKGNTAYQLNALHDSIKNNDAPQIEAPTQAAAPLEASPGKAHPPEPSKVEALRELMPKAMPTSAKGHSVQPVDAEGQALPASPPGIPSALNAN